MSNVQFLKIMFIGFFAGILLGNLLYYLVRSFKEDNVKEIEMKEDKIESREKENFRTIQEFNYSNVVSVKINHVLKKELREVYKRFGYNDKLINEFELAYDNESYKIIAELQQGIFKKTSSTDIANNIFECLRRGDGMVLFPDEIKRIIDSNLEN